MDGDFSAAAVVGEVMGKTEGFFAEGLGKLLLLFNLLLVKDAPEFVQSVFVSRLRAEMSCVGFLRMSIVPGATAEVVVLFASPLAGMERLGERPMVL